jgi:hypothetical protein
VRETLKRLDSIQEKTGFDYVINLDLTIHADDSQPDNLPRLRKSVRDFLDFLSEYLSHKGKLKGRLTGVFAVHVWGTSSLLPHFHVHLTIPNVLKTRRGFVRFCPKLNHEVVKVLWRKALRVNGLWPLDGPSLPDCHVSFVRYKERGRVVHRIRYVSRLPVVDLSEFLSPGFARDFDLEWAKYLLFYSPRIVWVGWSRGGKFGNSNEKNRENGDLPCPRCGWLMCYLGVKRSIPDLPWFVERRDGSYALFLADLPPGGETGLGRVIER